jgi:DNA-3-methyladenine glycosylase II
MVHETILLRGTPPFRLDFTVWALRRRQKNIIDRWDGDKYSRIVVFNNNPIQLTITQERWGNGSKLVIALQSKKQVTAQVRKQVKALVQRMFGLTIDLHPFYILANKNDVLKSLVAQFAGVKPPRFPNVFEALVNAIACQQVTLDLGILLLNRLSETFGPAFVDGATTYYAFPRPVDLAEASEQEIKKLGFSRQKACAIQELAANIANNQIELSGLEQMPNTQVFDFLLTIRGIGRWSAEYVLLRGLGRLNVFPGDDIGAQNNLQRLLQLDTRPDYQTIRTLSAQWSLYEGLVYFHLLLEKLQRNGVL